MVDARQDSPAPLIVNLPGIGHFAVGTVAKTTVASSWVTTSGRRTPYSPPAQIAACEQSCQALGIGTYERRSSRAGWNTPVEASRFTKLVRS
ncbi:MAG: hypothetical protein QOJ09_800, partial [Actinomycetota bacterium]|nr:hypothetical protein [Actinomycetota bacterium]